MGRESRYNANAIAARNGTLKPKRLKPESPVDRAWRKPDALLNLLVGRQLRLPPKKEKTDEETI